METVVELDEQEEAIKICVWSGYYSVEELFEMLADAEEDEAELEKKSNAEPCWPEVTDCDRLDRVFAKLEELGIIALQNAGYTNSDGLSQVDAELARRERSGVRGYCFFHGQDIGRAIADGGLALSFGDLDAVDCEKVKIGAVIKQALETAGFSVAWDSDPARKIIVPSFAWKRRSFES